jgi:methyl-accepting chemotaxis protein
MKLRIKLTLIVSAMTFAVMAVLAVVLLWQAVKDLEDVSSRNMKNITWASAEDMVTDFSEYIVPTRTLGQAMGDIKAFPPSRRRDAFDTVIKSVVESNKIVIGIYAVFKEGAIDDGNDEIFSPLYTKESGVLERHDFNTWNVPEYERCLASIAANDSSESITDPVPFLNQGSNTMVSFVICPIVDPIFGELMGFVGTAVDLRGTQEKIVTIKPFDTGQAVLVSSQMTIVADPDTRNRGKQVKEIYTKALGEAGVAALADSIKRGVDVRVDSPGFMRVCYPFHIGTVKAPWAIVCRVDTATVFGTVHTLIVFSIVFGIVMVVVTFFVIYFIMSSSLKPVGNVVGMLKEISEGEGDLTKQIKVKSKDEIGDLATYFNRTLGKIRELVVTIKRQAVSLSDVGNELSANMTETAAAMNEITANIASIKNRVLNQSASVTETNQTMEQITANIEKLNSQVETQTSSVARSSSAVEEMIANIQSVTNTLAKNAASLRELTESSEVGRTGLREVADDIQEIARESEGLLEINAAMENIAAQTNLLSMNAAIEAAHAGESGKGFAVVADEIRKLASSAGEQSKTSTDVLNKIHSSIGKITAATENVLKKFEAIDSGVKLVAEQGENIRNAMEEQSVGSHQILESVSQLNDLTTEVKEGSLKMFEGSKEVINECKNLDTATQEIANGINEITIGATDVNTAVNRVNEITVENKQSIDLLTAEVAKFKVE